MRTGNGGFEATLVGTEDEIAVDRALAEFRAGRPIRILDDDEHGTLALPLEGLTPERLAAFEALCAPSSLRLVVTARRARALGMDPTSAAVALPLPPGATAGLLLALATDAGTDRAATGELAGAAAADAIELAKLVQGLPAVLAAETHARQAAPSPALLTVKAGSVARFRAANIRSLAVVSEARVPLASGISTRFVVFRDGMGTNSVALVVGGPDVSAPVAVRLHSACLTGDVFGSRRCDCGDQLRLAMKRIEAAGGGVILYLPQEGRGLGLANKMRAYALQDGGLDTIDANTTLGFNEDERDYGMAARMLEILGITRVWLLTNNPAKLDGLSAAGIVVAGRVPLEAPVNADNRRYLAAKAARAGHQLDDLFAAITGAAGPERGANSDIEGIEARGGPVKA